jgi:CPA2 family monovalent cation:H+ antiporter-2
VSKGPAGTDPLDGHHAPGLAGRAGAVEVVPEALEAVMLIAAHALLLLLDMPSTRVVRRIQEQRGNRYRLLREFIRGDGGLLDDAHAEATILG